MSADEERAAIVAWLRAQAVYPANTRLIEHLSDMIEARAHRQVGE